MSTDERPPSSAGDSRSLITPGFVLVILTSFLFFFNFHSFILLPLRIKELRGTESDIGFIMGAAWLTTLITTPLVGILVDRYGKKLFLSAGTLLMAATTLPFADIDSLNIWFPVLRACQGIAFSLCFISAGTLSVDLTPPSKRSQALGLFGVFAIVNYALAPAVGKRVIEHFGFERFFLVVFALGLLAFAISLLVKEPRVESSPDDAGSYLETITQKGVPIVAIALLLAGSGFIPALTFLPVYSLDIGVPDYDLFFISYTVAVLGVRILGGWIPDRFGKKRTAAPSLLFFSLSIVALSLARSVAHFIPVGVVFGLAHGIFYPSLYALVMDLVPERDKGKGFSICSLSFTLGGMIGLFVYGVVAEASGYRFMYALAGLVSFLGFVLFSVFAKEGRGGS